MLRTQQYWLDLVRPVRQWTSYGKVFSIFVRITRNSSLQRERDLAHGLVDVFGILCTYKFKYPPSAVAARRTQG